MSELIARPHYKRAKGKLRVQRRGQGVAIIGTVDGRGRRRRRRSAHASGLITYSAQGKPQVLNPVCDQAGIFRFQPLARLPIGDRNVESLAFLADPSSAFEPVVEAIGA